MATKTPLADVLAKELGFKDAKALKENLKQRHGGDFADNFKSRLESGGGFGASFKGAIKDKIQDAKEAFSSKGLKKLGKSAYNEFFGGKDFISSYMRGRLAKQGGVGETGDKVSSLLGATPAGAGIDAAAEELDVLHIMAKNSMALHGMSRDMNVLRQNIVKLVKLENQFREEGDTHEATNKADAFFLKEDEREAKLEASKQKMADARSPKPEKKEEEKPSGGILESIMNFFSTGFLGSFKSLFNPMAILKVIGKVFVIATIIMSLFKGITAAFDAWKETGSIKEALIAGLGAITDFLTFGLFGEDSIRTLFDGVQQFLDPIIESVSSVVTSIKDWITNNVGIPEIKLGSIKAPEWLGGKTFDFGTIGPYYPFKSNPKSSQPEVSSTSSGAKPAVPKVDKNTTGDVSATTSASSDVPASPDTAPSKEADTLFNRQYLEFVASGKHPKPLISQDRAKELLSAMDKQKGATAEAAKPAQPAAATAPSASSGGGGGSSGGGSAPAAASGGASESPTGATSSPSPGESPTAAKGDELASKSAEVAEAQRMESAADAGSVVNAPTTNNSSKSSGKQSSSIADAYNTDFVNSYYATF
jgi:hypothetical protein